MHPLIILAILLCFFPVFFAEDPLVGLLTIIFFAIGAAVITTINFACSYFKDRRVEKASAAYRAETAKQRSNQDASSCCDSADIPCMACAAF